MPWGSGQVVEEISIQCPHWEPTAQLMEYEDGSRSLRFCYYINVLPAHEFYNGS